MVCRPIRPVAPDIIRASRANPEYAGQVNFTTATSATISGLDPMTTYYMTVTAMSDFTDPATLVTTLYESVLYPTQLPAVPKYVSGCCSLLACMRKMRGPSNIAKI